MVVNNVLLSLVMPDNRCQLLFAVRSIRSFRLRNHISATSKFFVVSFILRDFMPPGSSLFRSYSGIHCLQIFQFRPQSEIHCFQVLHCYVHTPRFNASEFFIASFILRDSLHSNTTMCNNCRRAFAYWAILKLSYKTIHNNAPHKLNTGVTSLPFTRQSHMHGVVTTTSSCFRKPLSKFLTICATYSWTFFMPLFSSLPRASCAW